TVPHSTAASGAVIIISVQLMAPVTSLVPVQVRGPLPDRSSVSVIVPVPRAHPLRADAAADLEYRASEASMNRHTCVSLSSAAVIALAVGPPLVAQQPPAAAPPAAAAA